MNRFATRLDLIGFKDWRSRFGVGMKSTLRRALGIADEIESFKFAGNADDPDGLYYSVHYLRELAIRFRAAAMGLDYLRLREALDRLTVDVDGNDFGEGVGLHAELVGITGLLHDAVEEWGDDPSRWQSSPVKFEKVASASVDEKPLHTKERESLLKLVIGMAVKGYAYDPSATKSDKPQEIADDLANLGLDLDADTVRKYLRQGCELMPGGATSQKR